MESNNGEQMKIFLKVIKTVALDVKCSDAIHIVKHKFSSIEGVSAENQELYFGGKHLKNSSTLAACKIPNYSTINLHVLPGIQVIVKILSTRRSLNVVVKQYDTVRTVKNKIHDIEGIPVDEQALVYQQMPLQDDRLLSSLDISSGSILHLVLRPKEDIKLSVVMVSGKTISMQVKTWYTLQDVKMLIESMENVELNHQKFVFMGLQLEESATLSHYYVNDGSVLNLIEDGITMQILVKTWEGKTITLTVQNSEKVEKVVDKIVEKMGKKCTSQKLFYDGKILEKGKSLAQYDIHRGSTLEFRLGAPCGEPRKLLVDTAWESSFSLYVVESDTISSVKMLIEEKTQVPTAEQILKYDGKELGNGKDTLETYGVALGSRLFLTKVGLISM